MTDKKLRLGIMAHLQKGVRSVYPRGPRSFWFDTTIQAGVEQAMCYMGFGAGQYYLSYGISRQATKDEVKCPPYQHARRQQRPPVYAPATQNRKTIKHGR